MQLSKPSAEPGGELVASGAGCLPGSPVAFTLAGLAAGVSVAGPDGSFSAPVSVPPALGLGRYDVDVQCGPVLHTTVDIVLTSQDAAPSSPIVVSLAILLFFMLLARRLFRDWRRVPDPPGTTRLDPDDMDDDLP